MTAKLKSTLNVISFDVLAILSFLLTVVLPFLVAFEFSENIEAPLPLRVLVWFFGSLLFSHFIIAFITLLLPRMKDGTHSLTGSSSGVSWIIRFQLKRFMSLFMIRQFLFNFQILRFFHLLVNGSNSDYDVVIAANADIMDPSLFNARSGTVIGAGTTIGGHLAFGTKIIIGEVDLGKNCLISAFCKVGPGIKIGENCVIGADTTMEGQIKIGPNSKIGNSCKIQKSVQIGANTVIGSNVIVEPRTTIGSNCVIPNGVVLKKGTQIPDGTHYSQAN